jgi:hypothetical protein
MGRGRASESELRTGLGTVGGLHHLADAGRVRKESPFGAPDRELKPGAVAATESPAPVATISLPVAPKAGRKSRARQPSPTEVCGENVTVPMTWEMRAEAVAFAAELQRRRTDKSERITANAIFRVAIEVFLRTFKAPDVGGINSEAELLADALRQGKGRRDRREQGA